MTETAPQTITVLGTGSIGTAIATVLAARGHALRVYNRSRDRMTQATRAGAEGFSSAADAAQGADLVLVTVTDYEAVDALLDVLREPVTPATVAVLTTGTADRAAATARRVEDLGFAALDAGVQTAPPDIGTPKATFLFGGAPEAFERHGRVFEQLGTCRYVGAEPSAAAIWDAALFGVWYDAQLGLLRALEAVIEHGIDPIEFAQTARVQLGHAAETAEATGHEVSRREYPRGPADLREHLPVLEQLVDLHGSGRLGDGGAAEIAERVRKMIEAGHGAEGLTALLAEAP